MKKTLDTRGHIPLWASRYSLVYASTSGIGCFFIQDVQRIIRLRDWLYEYRQNKTTRKAQLESHMRKVEKRTGDLSSAQRVMPRKCEGLVQLHG